MKNTVLSLALFALVSLHVRAADEFVADELLVSFKPGTRGTVADAIRQGVGGQKLNAWTEIHAEHWHLPRGLGVSKAIEALSHNPNILYAEPNYFVQASSIPRDPLLPKLWGLHNLGLDAGTMDADSDIFEAWDVSSDASGIVVAVIDTGVDYNHPDLAANIWSNPGETGPDSQGRNKATNGIDDDGNGFVDDAFGWNFVNNTNNPLDDNSHGTHVAGTIGAVDNNGIGLSGIARGVKIMPLKFLDSNGNGSTANAVNAMLYAAKFVNAAGSKIVRIYNCSYGSLAKSKTEENAIKASGALVVASAGNNATSTPQYPAGYAQPNLMAVAATDRNDLLASFSNFGSWVHLAAPGVDILSAAPDANYGFKSGTSMAAPHVSGVAALLMAHSPNFSVADIRSQILNNVDSLLSLSGKTATGGRLNARRALGAPEFPPDTTPPASIADLSVTGAALTSISLSWTAPGAPGVDSPAYFYDLRWASVPITEANFTYASPLDVAPQDPGAVETFTVERLLIAGTYYFAVKSYDLAGNASPISNIASATTLDNDWRFMTVWSGKDMANTVSAARNFSGGWTITTDDTGTLKFFNYVAGAGGYQVENIGPITGGASVAYDAAWVPAVGYISAGKLNFAQKTSSAWSITTVESRDVLNGDTSTSYDTAGAAWVTYPKGGRSPGLYAARRIGTSWTIISVEKNGGGIYNQLAIAPDGKPSVAYAVDITGDGKADLLKLAHFSGATWSISAVDTAPTGPVSLAFNPIDGNPVIASRSGANNELRFYRSLGSVWTSELIDPAIPIQSCSIACHSDGTVWVAYATLTDMRAAKRAPSTGTWTTMLIDPDGPGTCRTALYIGPATGRPLTVYGGPSAVPGYTDGLRLAVKQSP